MGIIIAVSAGHNKTKKDESVVRKRIRYLNYGLLGLVTMIKHQGKKEIVLYQADFYTVNMLLEHIENSGIDINKDCDCFLLSIPSYYSMSWSEQFCETVKRKYQKPIIVGGRWVVDNHVDWIKQQLKHVDAVIEGFGERKLAEYLELPGWEKIPDGKTKCFDWLDYRLLDCYEKYQPCIEVSRGCGSGCSFCADKNNSRLPNKSVSIIESELEYLDSIYGRYSVYFEAPHFVFNESWINQLCEMLNKREKQIQWRCTSRVETVPINLIRKMSNAGLKILDIGLESASYTQLINMHKTNNPVRYLDMADKLLVECNKNDVWVKFNLLLYAGETEETIHETVKWLLDRKDLIKDVSVSNLVYYYNMDSIEDLKRLGATIPEGEDFQKTGYVELNLSNTIDVKKAKMFASNIPKLIANQKDFYDIKSISYFEPSYTYEEFLRDIKICDNSVLPFYIDEKI